MHKIYISLATQPSSYINLYFAFNPVEYNISNLCVYTLYVVRVSAVNEAGEGPKSKAVTTRTLEGGEFIPISSKEIHFNKSVGSSVTRICVIIIISLLLLYPFL